MHNASKRFGQYFEDSGKKSERPADYSNDPRFNEKAAKRAEFDFYKKMDKAKGMDDVLDRGDRARQGRGH